MKNIIKSIDSERAEFCDWLKQALIRNAMSPSELARRVDVSRQAVTNWMNNGKIKLEKLRAVEEVLGERSPLTQGAFSGVYQVTTGNGSKIISSDIDVTPILLIDWGEVGEDLSQLENMGDRREFINPDRRAHQKMYALEIKGLAMKQVFCEKDIVFVEDKDYKNGDYVIVKHKGDDEAMLCRYQKQAGVVTLAVGDDVHSPPEDSYKIHGVVVGKYKPF